MGHRYAAIGLPIWWAEIRLFTGKMAGREVVGGSSLHWQASAFLPYPIDYIHWQEETGVDWTSENLLDAVEETRREFSIHEYPEEVNTPW